MNTHPRTSIFLPPLNKTAGGLAVLLRLAACLDRAGHSVFLAPREVVPDAVREYAPDVPLVPFEDLRLTPSDIWLVPEGWPNALAPGLTAKARCVVYCQNWAYLFNGLPQGVTWRDLPVSFLAVSDPVARFIELATGTIPPVLRPGIDLDLFAAPAAKPEGPVRVAFMPRKNKALADQIRTLSAARTPMTGLDLQFVEIRDMTQAQVAQTLATCHIFLACGFPEGCPLPPLEAMACGCLVVGYAGLGGLDYLRPIPPSTAPAWPPLRPTPWGPNAFVTPDADVAQTVLALEAAARLILENGPALAEVSRNMGECARSYSLEAQAEAARAVWGEMG
ncbi:glycosyltransferase family 4 protein [Desulfolutivibrio sulfoxidireducens]|uniref:glycosyltransferase family 4 protein n=1 Tax=Desulfolutivibrio sulfoxidireducens TaxID=2773299 RepID=UPI00159DFB40|nr:glycosyltransferase family 4 protein [Desulfolutivibrio sulfoxidireducens]QLA17470.1 glycosyltransferase family 1 protein [Desulfolutivibrio sulfoxidireducens]